MSETLLFTGPLLANFVLKLPDGGGVRPLDYP